MKCKGKAGFGFWLMLVFACLLLLSRSAANHCNAGAPNYSAGQDSIPELQDSPAQSDLTIENSSFFSGISEDYRLLTVKILHNRVVPLNFNFRNMTFIPERINFKILIPIFIQGHALLN